MRHHPEQQELLEAIGAEMEERFLDISVPSEMTVLLGKIEEAEFALRVQSTKPAVRSSRSSKSEASRQSEATWEEVLSFQKVATCNPLALRQ